MGERKRVAVCDDDQAIADLVGQLLAEAGLEARAFYGASDLLAALGREPFDLVILDVMMPVMDGFSCCREIRRASSVPVIFLTAKDEEVDKQTPIIEVAGKTFTKAEVNEQVEAVIGG